MTDCPPILTTAQIPKEHWSYPEWINQTYAADERQKMVNENVIVR